MATGDADITSPPSADIAAPPGADITAPPDAAGTIARVIRRRRMTRGFDDRPLPVGLLDELLDLARRAPSAGYSQGVHFLVLTGDELAAWWAATVEPDWVEAIAAGIGTAQALVIPVADPDAYTQRYSEPDKLAAGLSDAAAWIVPFWLTDAAMATQNLLLLLEANGLGALYYGLSRERAALATLGVPPSTQPLGAVAIGYRRQGEQPSGSPIRRGRRDITEVVHRGRW